MSQSETSGDVAADFRKYVDHPISGSEFVPIHQNTLRQAADEIERLRRLLGRYLDETPLGHQPHMIAHEVEAALGRRAAGRPYAERRERAEAVSGMRKRENRLDRYQLYIPIRVPKLRPSWSTG